MSEEQARAILQERRAIVAAEHAGGITHEEAVDLARQVGAVNAGPRAGGKRFIMSGDDLASYAREVERRICLAAQAATAPQPVVQTLQRDIMNLPCEVGADLPPAVAVAYKAGHRDARHAAAELVSAAVSKATD